MPVPTPRTPICIARGNKADLTANLTALSDGEICYALDEDALYVKEGGVLVKAAGASTPYVLPTATASTLGGVKIGANVNVAGGTISVVAATNVAPGVVRIATDAEATAGTLETVAINAKQLKTLASSLPPLTKDGDVLTVEASASPLATAFGPYNTVPTYDPQWLPALQAGALPDPLNPSQPYRDGGGTQSTKDFAFIYSGKIYTLTGQIQDLAHFGGTPDTWSTTGTHPVLKSVAPAPSTMSSLAAVWKAPAGLPVGVQNLDLLQWDNSAKQWTANRVTDGGNF